MHEWTPAIGLYHVGAQEYARWLRKAPIDLASGDPNLYRYCGNDTVNYADAGGAEWFKKTGRGPWIASEAIDSLHRLP